MRVFYGNPDWDITVIPDITGAFDVSIFKFLHNTDGKIYFHPFSPDSDVFVVGESEFVVYTGSSICHLGFDADFGTEIYSETHYIREFAPLFDSSLFLYCTHEGEQKKTYHIYSVKLRQKLDGDFFKDLIDPMVEVTIKEDAKIVLKVPYLERKFRISSALEPVPTLSTPLFGRLPEESNTIIGYITLDDISSDGIYTFDDFKLVAIERCRQIKKAEDYEKTGGYFINGELVHGLFAKQDGGPEYYFSPERSFDLAIAKLLTTNGLYPTNTGEPCDFVGKTVDEPGLSIEYGYSAILITERNAGEPQTYMLDTENCVGVTRLDEHSFLALVKDWGPRPVFRMRRFYRTPGSSTYVWDTNFMDYKGVVNPDGCMLYDDIILYTDTPTTGDMFVDYKLWSIKDSRQVYLLNDCQWFSKNTTNYICYMTRQIIVRDGSASGKPKPMVALRLFRPRDYCDVYALIDPARLNRIYGKSYNMLADAMTKKPRTIGGLAKIFKDNERLKKKYSL